MLKYRLAVFGVMVIALSSASSAPGQQQDPAVLIAAQREAMKPLAMMDGVWRGPAWTMLPSGQKHNITQTERIGPFLDGSVKVIEGRGYNEDGSVGFNAFAIVSYDPSAKAFTMHSHAQGRVGDFIIKPTADGFTWEIPAGPTMTIRYTATIKNSTWREVGDRIAPGKEPVRFFEMNLKRVGDTDWPASGSVAPK